MKIAVTYDNGAVFPHFGHTAQFKLYETENNVVIRSEVIDTAGSGHEALGRLLASHQVNALICGGIGAGAQRAVLEAGIILFAGITGSADDAVQALLDGTLRPGAAGCCGHHGEAHDCGHHGEEHDCGHHREEHDCGHCHE